jgi:hypothetical protein
VISAHTASHPATHWRSDQGATYDTAGGLAVCPSNVHIELSITPPRTGGLLGGLTPKTGGLTLVDRAHRQTANGDAGVAG